MKRDYFKKHFYYPEEVLKLSNYYIKEDLKLEFRIKMEKNRLHL